MLLPFTCALLLSAAPDAGVAQPVQAVTLHVTGKKVVITVGATTLQPLTVTRDAKGGLDVTQLRDTLREVARGLPEQHSVAVVQAMAATDDDVQRVATACSDEHLANVVVRRAAPGEAAPEPTPLPPTELTVVGALDKAAVQKVLDQHRADVDACFKGKKPSRLAVKLIINPSGAVVSAGVVQESPPDPQLSGCIANAVGRWAFPKPAKGLVTITAPLGAR